VRLWSLSFAAAAIAMAAPNAFPQIECDTQTCTFTLSFDSARGEPGSAFRFVTGAPYSGQESNESNRTLQDGTHTSTKVSGPLIYRDSKGRMRTERSVYGRRPDDGRPKPPDDFTVVEIHDPVAGFEYILDPVTRVAHRMAFKPGASQEFTSAMLRPPGAPSSFTTPNGLTTTEESLGPEAMFGAAAVGVRRTTANTGATETWLDPRTGIILLRKDDNAPGNGMTMTMLSYSNAEPDAALFQIPEGYKVVDEAGAFKVVHTRTGPNRAVSSAGPQTPRSAAECNDASCTVTFDLTSQPPMAAITGAPYSGRDMMETPARTMLNGRQLAPMTHAGTARYRDSAGRMRIDKTPMQVRGGSSLQNEIAFVEIDDPVAGFQYILDAVDHTAYRVPWQARLIPFERRPNFQPAGTSTFANGTVDVEEDLGEKTIDGVTAMGHRTTQTNPPGTRQGNDRPIVNITERWVDPNTGITLLGKQSGSQAGSTSSIPDYKPADPDPSLFQIPSDYKVIDEPSKFTFVISR
jgi:hypothetical protein